MLIFRIMKSSTLYSALKITLLVFLLSSCFDANFKEVQPHRGKLLNYFPKNMHGNWNYEQHNEESKLVGKVVIDSNSFELQHLTDKNRDEKHHLSDSLLLYKKRSLYVLNFKEDGFWRIMVLDQKGKSHIEVAQPFDLKVLIQDKSLQPVQLKDGDEEVDVNSDYETSDIDHALFSGQMKYKTLKKILETDKFKYHLYKSEDE